MAAIFSEEGIFLAASQDLPKNQVSNFEAAITDGLCLLSDTHNYILTTKTKDLLKS